MSFLERFLNQLIPYGGSIYRRIGGTSTIDSLVEEFYLVMRTDPRAQHCLATHAGRDMKEAAEKLKAFLAGWLGGPQLYLNKYGHPRMRARHMSFSIGEIEAKEWLYCMQEALMKSKISQEDQRQMLAAFEGLSKLIRNRD